MKVLVCGTNAAVAEIAEAAVYDAGALPIGPVGNALAALGLADQERPHLAIVDLSSVDGGTDLWLAEKLAERGIELVCLTEDALPARLALRYPDIVAETASRHALAERIAILRQERRGSRASRPPIDDLRTAV